MGFLEIVLLLAGVLLAVASFFVPTQKEDLTETKKLAKSEIKTLVNQEMDNIRQHVDDVVDEAVEYAMEKTERSLERLTNEKIMAVNEYSDTVLQEINKSHEEVMFLYDMLNSKHANLQDTVSKATQTAMEVTETTREATREAEAVVSNFQQLIPEAVTATNVVEPVAEAEVDTEPATESPAITVMDFMASGDTNSVGMNNNERILELYKQGKSNVAIAKELGLGVGEVKLVIQLFKNT